MKTLESTAPFQTEIGEVLVSARGLQKSFHGRTIMRNVDFDMHAGDITVIIGKSGSGKSTMLRALAGLTEPDEGTIDFDGVRVFEDQQRTEAWADKSFHVGMVFQTYTLWPHMNVLDKPHPRPPQTPRHVRLGRT